MTSEKAEVTRINQRKDSIPGCQEGIRSYRDKLRAYEASLKPFADMISEATVKLPPNTKFAPKMTLEPFIAAHKAIYGDRSSGEA